MTDPSTAIKKPFRPAARAWVVLLLAMLASCGTIEEKRIRQLLHEKGFGTRAQGVASQENYVAGGDLVQFLVPSQLYTQPGMEQLYLLNRQQPVRLDGTIYVPYVGPLYVLGMTETQLSSLVSQQLDAIFAPAIDLQAIIVSTGKGFYMFGEIEGPRYIPMPKADMTLLEVIARANITTLANLGRVKVVKPDARNPLVVPVNVREILETGNTTFNLRIDPNDIVYIPPTFFGHISRFLEKIFEPIGTAVRTLIGVATVQASYEYLFFDETDPLLFRGGGRGRGF